MDYQKRILQPEEMQAPTYTDIATGVVNNVRAAFHAILLAQSFLSARTVPLLRALSLNRCAPLPQLISKKYS